MKSFERLWCVAESIQVFDKWLTTREISISDSFQRWQHEKSGSYAATSSPSYYFEDGSRSSATLSCTCSPFQILQLKMHHAQLQLLGIPTLYYVPIW